MHICRGKEKGYPLIESTEPIVSERKRDGEEKRAHRDKYHKHTIPMSVCSFEGVIIHRGGEGKKGTDSQKKGTEDQRSTPHLPPFDGGKRHKDTKTQRQPNKYVERKGSEFTVKGTAVGVNLGQTREKERERER